MSDFWDVLFGEDTDEWWVIVWVWLMALPLGASLGGLAWAVFG